MSLTLCTHLFAQQHTKNTIDIEQASELTYEEANGERVRRLIGNVILKQQDVRLFCDSALLYADSKLAKAFGNVRIVQEGKFNGTCRYLEYNGQTKDAVLRQNVYLTDGEMNLTTEELFYNTNTKIARYQQGALIRNAEATLKSLRGTYDSNTKQFYYRTRVSLDHRDFKLTADTLLYNNLSERADFVGPTNIKTDRSKTYTEGGWYKSKTKEFYLNKNGRIAVDSQQFIKADTIYFDENKELGYCRGNVQMIDTVEKTEIRGGYSRFNRKAGWNLVYEYPLLINFGEKDSLYLTADTIYQYKDKNEKSVMRAWRLPVIQQADLLVHCDSLSYVEADSMFRLFTLPIIWSGGFQITSEFKEIYTKGKAFDRMEMYRESFMVKQEDSLHYSQIKGKDVTAYFSGQQISRMDVKGNGESIYYVEDESGEGFMGANKIESSNITILLEDNKPVDIRFYVKPVAVMTPIDKVDPVAFRLKGFNWQGERLSQVQFRMAEALSCSPEQGWYAELYPQKKSTEETNQVAPAVESPKAK
jgi:lipopolysaccharide export system protein LptA